MRLKVILSNGDSAREIIWLRHMRTDVYAGMPGHSSKRSYHEKGQVHTKENKPGGVTIIHDVRAPLGELDTLTPMYSVWMTNENEWFSEASPLKTWRGKPTDHIIFFDVRGLDTGVPFGVDVGIVPREGWEQIAQRFPSTGSQRRLCLDQLSLNTTNTPWIYGALLRPGREGQPTHGENTAGQPTSKQATAFIAERGFLVAFSDLRPGEQLHIMDIRHRFGNEPGSIYMGP